MYNVSRSLSVHIFSMVAILAVCANAQTFEGIVVIKETSKHRFEWQDSDMRQEEIKQLDREIKELEAEVKTLTKSDKQIALEELEILRQSRISLETGVGVNVSIRTVYIKPGMMRVEETGQEEITIFRLDKNIVWTIVPGEKGYMESNLSEFIKATGETSKNATERYSKVTEARIEKGHHLIKHTGKKDISGYLCEQFLRVQGKDTTEFWTSKELSLKAIFGARLNLFVILGGDETIKETLVEVEQIGGFPMLIITRNDVSEEIIKVDKIKTKQLHNNMFEIPAGFNKLTFEDMLKGE